MKRGIAHWADRHARSVLFLWAALVAAGVFAASRLSVSLFPQVDFPRIRIHFDAGERPAERMVVQVTRPVEEALRAVRGIRKVESASSRGSCEISLNFEWGADMNAALMQTEAQINKVLPTLPAGTTFDIRRMDPTVFPVIAYSLTSKTTSQGALLDITRLQLRGALSSLPGVARIGIQGGDVDEFRVIVNPAKLAERNLALGDVASALAAANVIDAVGIAEDHRKAYLVVTNTRLEDISQIEELPLRSGAGGVVRLKEVATVARLAAPQTTRVTADGELSVQLDVYQQPGGNTVEIAQSIRDALAVEAARLPKDVKLTCWYDQSDLITASAQSVREAVLIGVGLAALVLLLFLRNWRITLVAALAVPVVLAVTALALRLLGQSFNIMTLGGMAAAVGLIIDDAIVMSEHIVRRLQARKAAAREVVLDAAEEFTRPLVGSSLSTIVIHIPPAFMIGVAGAFFAALSLSMAASLVVSLATAWLVIPVLASRFLKAPRGGAQRAGAASGIDQGPVPAVAAAGNGEESAGAAQADANGGGAAVLSYSTRPIAQQRGAYAAVMRRVLAFPVLALLVAAPLLFFGWRAEQDLPTGFMPSIDEGGFVLDYVAPPGYSLKQTDEMLKIVEKVLHETREVATFSRRTGVSLGEDLQETNMGDFFIRLKPFPRRPIDEIMEDVEKRVNKAAPKLDVELAKLMEDLIGDLVGKPEPVVVNLFCEDEETLAKAAERVTEELKKIPELQEVRSGVVPAGDAFNIEVNRVNAALEGMDAQQVADQLESLLSGKVATQIHVGDRMVDVRVWIPKRTRQSRDEVQEMKLRAPDGHLVPLKRIATFSTISGQPEITREDLKRVAAVTARSTVDLKSSIRDVRSALEKKGVLPDNVRFTLGGMYEQQQIAFKGLVQVIAAGAVLVFLLLLYMYESFRIAAAILFTTALAIAFVFLALAWTHVELNISSLMGVVMIVGNVTEVAIFFCSEFVDFGHSGTAAERLIAAGAHRMRAIAMTSVAAILALLPLALGAGQGTAMLQPLAVAIIAGLAAQLPLVLVVLPALLLLMGVGRREERRTRETQIV